MNVTRNAPGGSSGGEQNEWYPADGVICTSVNGDGVFDERLWVVQDANYNVTAIFDNSGNVVERFI